MLLYRLFQRNNGIMSESGVKIYCGNYVILRTFKTTKGLLGATFKYLFDKVNDAFAPEFVHNRRAVHLLYYFISLTVLLQV